MLNRAFVAACVLALFCLMPLVGCAPSDRGGSDVNSADNTTTAAE